MDLNDLATFVAVTEHGSFSKAANALGIAKSTVSERVRGLEQELGAQLLQRTTRRFRLTEAGEALVERGRTIVALAAEAEDDVTAATRRAVGQLRVSAPISFGLRFLNGVIAELVRDNPQLSVDFQLEDRSVDLIAERFDLAVRIGRLAESSLVARRVGASRRRVVASPTYVAAHGEPREPRDLRQHECLRYAHQRDADVWIFDRPEGGEDHIRVSGRLQSNHGDALAQLACDGVGVAWLPEFIVEPFLDDGRLVSLLSEHCVAEMPVHVVFPTRAFRTHKEKLFVDALTKRLT